MTSPVLFLDIDGVLNAHEFDPDIMCGQIHRDKVALLNVVLRETEAKVVLSSAWRYIVYRNEANLAGMEWLLRSHGMLANRLIGITRQDTMIRGETFSGEPSMWLHTNERGAQITDWLADNPPPRSYAVVDDLDLGITEAGHPLVQTTGTVGLTITDTMRLIEILNCTGKGAQT